MTPAPAWLLAHLLLLRSTSELAVCYLMWAATFLLINVTWDIGSSRTPRFHLLMLPAKVAVLHHAVAFCSCILVLAALVDESIRDLSEETVVPLVIAAIAGIMQALPAMCPYTRAGLRSDRG